MFASDLDAASRRQLDRGARLTELLRQPQYTPYPVEEQVVSVWAGNNGYFDSVPVNEVLRFERDLLDHLRRNTSILTTIADTKQFDADTQQALVAEIDKVKASFEAVADKLVDGADKHAKPLEDGVAKAEQIRV